MGRFRLQTKLLMLSVFFLMVTLIVGLVAALSNRGISSEYQELIQQTLPKEKYISTFYENFLKIRMNIRNLGLPGISPEDAARSEKTIQEGLARIEETRKAYESLGFTPGQKELYDQQIQSWTAFLAVGQEVLNLHKSGRPEDIQKMVRIFFSTCPESADRFTEATKKLREFHQAEIFHSTNAAKDISKTAMTANILTIIFGLIVGLSLGFIFSRSLARSLTKISKTISSLATQTSAGASELSRASSQLSDSSNESAASLEETVASLEELTSMVKLNTSGAQQAHGLSQKSQVAAENGEAEISKLIASMSEIAVGSKKIEEIITVIDDIAFQTNLLALNASVEAARAGEQGKGFSVVAEAVRSLAQRSASAAKDISILIKENVANSENGARTAATSGQALKEILSSVRKVAELNGEIAAGSAEQANGLEQISKAMNQLDQSTQDNASSAQKVASSSHTMEEDAQSLAKIATSLHEIVYGVMKSSFKRHFRAE